MAENSSNKRKLQNYSKSHGESEPKRLRLTTTDTLKQEAAANINHLPNEILEMIFSHLEVKHRIRNELVCKRWHWIQRSWQPELIIKIVRFHFDDRAISSLLSRCGRDLRKLEIVNVHDEKPELSPAAFKILVKAIVNHCSNLKELKLFQLPLNSISLEKLSVICTKLKVACLHNLQDDIGNGLSEFLMQCKGLEVLDVEGYIGETCFAGVSKKLKILRLTRSYVHRSVIKCVWERCDKLTELSLTECSNYCLNSNIKETSWKQYKDTLKIFHLDRMCLDFLLNLLAENCITLEDLCVSTTCISDSGLICLQTAACLKVLDISRNTSITDTGINFLRNLPALESLNAGFLPKVSLKGFMSLARSCSNLKLLDVRGNDEVSNEVVQVLDSRLRSGDLKGNLTLLVWYSSVTYDVERCGKLKLDFRHNTPFCEKPLRVVENVWHL